MRYGSITHAPAAQGTASPWRSALTLGALALFTTGQHYGKHSISGLGPALMNTLDVQRTRYAFLFSFEQIPSILLPAVGGLLLQHVVLTHASIALAIALLLAATICAMAVDARSYNTLLLGRAIFGAAEGLLTTVQGALIAQTYRDSGGIGGAFGVMLLASRVSSFAGFTVPPLLLNNASLSTAMWFGTIATLLPIVATFVHSRIAVSQPPPRHAVEATRQLGIPFWLIAYGFMTVASTTFTFTHFAPDVFNSHIVQGVDALRAALLSGTLFLAAGLSSPFIGLAEDRLGGRVALLVTSSTCSSIALALCAATVRWPQVLGAKTVLFVMLLLMISLCVAPVTLLTCIAVVVPDAAIPVALGLYKSLENAGLAIVHLIVGRLRDTMSSYAPALLFLSLLAASAVPAFFVLHRLAPQLRRGTSKLECVEKQ